MDQTSAFRPDLYVKLMDGRTVRFARSSSYHWADMCEQIKAAKLEPLYADIDVIAKDAKPSVKISLRHEARDFEVSVDEARYLCKVVPKWRTIHLKALFIAAGGKQEDFSGALLLMDEERITDIAVAAADMPVVKDNKAATEENPLVAGIDLAKLNESPDSTGEPSSSSSSESVQASMPAA